MRKVGMTKRPTSKSRDTSFFFPFLLLSSGIGKLKKLGDNAALSFGKKKETKQGHSGKGLLTSPSLKLPELGKKINWSKHWREKKHLLETRPVQ